MSWQRKMVGVCVVALGFSSAWAVPVSYTIEQGGDASFGYSFLHGATHDFGMAPFLPGGEKYFRINGTLTGDFNGITLTLDPVTLTATGLGSGPGAGENWTMEILGGMIDAPDAIFDDSLLGTIDYRLIDDLNVEQDAGTFYIFDRDFGVPPILNGGEFTIWANNWRNFATSGGAAQTRHDVPLALGFDLKATDPTGGPTIPEPGTLVMLLGGVACLGMMRRRRTA